MNDQSNFNHLKILKFFMDEFVACFRVYNFHSYKLEIKEYSNILEIVLFN